MDLLKKLFNKSRGIDDDGVEALVITSEECKQFIRQLPEKIVNDIKEAIVYDFEDERIKETFAPTFSEYQIDQQQIEKYLPEALEELKK